MNHQPQRFAVFGSLFQTSKSSAVASVLRVLRAHQAHVAIEASFFRFITDGLGIAFTPDAIIDDADFSADIVLSVGGDGTFLSTAARVGAKGIPILGINVGHLGFLAEVSPTQIEEVIAQICNGDYSVESRSQLLVETSAPIPLAHPIALNEVAILKHEHSSMITVDAYVNGRHLATYQSDGLLVSTPTGSTAYSLSVGGPIIAPSSRSIALTPVAAHSLNMRSVVLDDNIEIHLDVRSRNHNYLLSIDGTSQSLTETVALTIRRAPYDVRVVRRRDNSFFDILREKLMWASDYRN